MKNIIQEIKETNINNFRCDFMLTLFGDTSVNFVKKKEKVIIYGAGSAGIDMFNVLKLHGVDTFCFVDQEKKKTGKVIGLDVISPEVLISKFKNFFVVIAVQKFKAEIFNLLKKEGLLRVGFIENDLQFYYYLQFPRWKIDLEIIERDKTLIKKGYRLLSDEKSKKIYVKRLSALTSYADFNLYTKAMSLSDYPSDLPDAKKIFASSFENQMYFENDLIELSDKCSLVDCGAYDGNSVTEFDNSMKMRGYESGEVYCFEPDASNFKLLKSNLCKNPRINLFNYGVYDKKECLKFSSSDSMYPTEACIVENEEDKVIKISKSDATVEVDSIDNLIYPNRVDIIKMDVEGAELKALIGSSKTILRWQPQLLISAYHKGTDLYNLLLLINKLNPKYRIYLRHFSFSWSETVLIAKV